MTSSRRSRFITYLASRKYVLVVLIVGLVCLVPWLLCPSNVVTFEYQEHTPLYGWLLDLLLALNGGRVSHFLIVLPSVFALLILCEQSFSFFCHKTTIERALLAVLFMITFEGLHCYQSLIGSRVLATMFVVLSLYSLYHWSEKFHLRGLPWGAGFLACGAVLSYGPLVLVSPVLIVTFYLWSRGYGPWSIARAVTLYTLIALFIPIIWYWRQGILSSALLHPSREEYSLASSLLGGLFPWILLILFIPWSQARTSRGSLWRTKPYLLYSLFVMGTTCLVELISFGKSGILVSSMYPFAGILSAELVFYFAKYHRIRLLTFTWLINAISIMVCATMILIATGALSVLIDTPLVIALETGVKKYFGLLTMFVLVLVVAILTTVYQTHRRSFSKLTYCNAFLAYLVLLNLDTLCMISMCQECSSFVVL